MNPTIQKSITAVKNNILGTIAGGIGGFYAAKKIGGISNKWVLGGLAIVGGLVGASIQSRVTAAKSKPTAADVKKK